ncbi:MAG: four helix bundle protein [Chloroflexota bacterium]
MIEKTDRSGKGFRKLIVWQRAHQLVLQVYKLTEKFPKHEMFGLTSQLRRAVVSVSANVAEGYAAGGKGQFKRYLDIAQGSLAEAEYYLILAQDLNYITPSQYEQAETLRAETGFLLHRLLESLDRK